jgi:uncharacterized protein (DUF1501 family)
MDDQHGIDCGCEEYNELSRRQFITASAGVSAAAFFPAWLPKIVMSNHYASNRDIIVSVFMRGGADGLSIAVPFADPNYYTSRSTIAIPRPDSSAATKGINLDGFFMFPQAMTGNAAGTGRTDAGVHGDGPADRPGDRTAQQLALALRRPAVHGSR